MQPLTVFLPVLLLGSPAWAGAGSSPGQDRILLAGEILIGPDRAAVQVPNARSQRDRAAAYQQGADDVPEDEDGILAPRGGAPAEERAFDSRMRARAYQPGPETPVAAPGMLPGVGDLMAPATAQERARDLRDRARSYGRGKGQGLDLSLVGADGIPLVPCKDADNVAARIGDDGAAGNIFYVMRDGKPVKVRCRKEGR